MLKKVAILANGGDVSGFNAVIRAIIKTAESNGIECYGFIDGYNGLLKNDYIKDTNDKPLVSIITSYYNSQEFMWQTINCVLNQTFPYWEWIIVDDGSTDKNSVEYLEKVKNTT